MDPRPNPLIADVADPASVAAALARVAEQATVLDGLVNAAGVVSVVPFEDLSADDWETTYRINVVGTFLVIQAALAAVARRGDSQRRQSGVDGRQDREHVHGRVQRQQGRGHQPDPLGRAHVRTGDPCERRVSGGGRHTDVRRRSTEGWVAPGRARVMLQFERRAAQGAPWPPGDGRRGGLSDRVPARPGGCIHDR